MNRTKLKAYAPQARRDFIQAMKDRAGFYGLTEKKIEPVTVRGDVAVISGREYLRSIAEKRRALEVRIRCDGFEATMEALAYTWFNRFVAIRFMELHGYLDHGYRVLSHPEGKLTPEILEHAEHVNFSGLKKDKVIDLKLAENKESELYRLLLTAQCNGLNTAMPFLFERIDDETELLLPDNLLHSDSVIRKLVDEIEEEDWKEVEIIGWLYQFYISEKKDEVIGKVVASEDIPAATQLFTPNWIVKYLVQNTLGRQWLATYPQSELRRQMEYYIDPAEQTLEVKEQLKAITPTSLDPEELTLLDPACGSGHILTEAYDLLKAIYQERGYRAKDIPALILHKNLFGLEIDDRAAQLASFALMMKARADDRRIFDSETKPNILAFRESRGLDVGNITNALNSPIHKDDAPRKYLFEEIEDAEAPLLSKKALAEKGHVSQRDIASLLALFENAKTFGSLIQIPPNLAAKLPEIEQRLHDVLKNGDLTQASAHVIKPLLQQARLLAIQYDAVVANPPYMGSKFYSSTLKLFVNREYNDAKPDLYACFIDRNATSAKSNGFVGMITIPNWMFISSFEEVRKSLVRRQTIDTFIHNGRGVFGADFGSCAFAFRNASLPEYRGSYRRLFHKQGSVASNEVLQERFGSAMTYTPTNASFTKVPGNPIAYWATAKAIDTFQLFPPMSEMATPRAGMITSNNAMFVRLWHEVPAQLLGLGFCTREEARRSQKKWFPYQKGGPFRKWYGNAEYVVNWLDDGKDIRKRKDDTGRIPAHAFNEEYIFRPNVNWSAVTISHFSARITDKGCLFDAGGSAAFPNVEDVDYLAGFLNSPVCQYLIGILNPTVNFQAWDIAKLPIKHDDIDFCAKVSEIVARAKLIARQDWDSFETSWCFTTMALLQYKAALLSQSQQKAEAEYSSRFRRMKELEAESNGHFIEAYGLKDELSPEVPDDQVTLSHPDCGEDVKRLLSYAIGCMMGRYSLDKQGLIYARSGNQGFDASQYERFRADDDGIIPLLETDWGIRDDAANRIVEFIGVAWPKEYLDENLKFIADNLGATNSEQPRDTIRRYLAVGLYKHHLMMYKRRPIYWLFSSGKQRAFQCLIYLHRYHEGTLARMRTEYVIPLQGRMAARIAQIEGDKSKATGTSQRRKLQKEQDDLKKQQIELGVFEEKLKHFADQRIKLDLDDGVKFNYGKFGDLLAESRAIAGSEDDG